MNEIFGKEVLAVRHVRQQQQQQQQQQAAAAGSSSSSRTPCHFQIVHGQTLIWEESTFFFLSLLPLFLSEHFSSYLLFHSSCPLYHSFFLLLFLSFYVLFKYFNLLIFPSFYVLFHSLFTSLNVTLISQNCNMCTSVQMRE